MRQQLSWKVSCHFDPIWSSGSLKGMIKQTRSAPLRKIWNPRSIFCQGCPIQLKMVTARSMSVMRIFYVLTTVENLSCFAAIREKKEERICFGFLFQLPAGVMGSWIVCSLNGILGQPPDMVNTRKTLISLHLGSCVNRKILWLTDSQILTCVNHTI